ncbi:hypothetical protein [Mycobacterium sp. OTB74]|jgi:hypothetical protein|nr:hypothetical protein [Mycobacterium sp. OTB74]MDH6243891.1 hypothetical protein [Mycobacterium sp. OTB74]
MYGNGLTVSVVGNDPDTGKLQLHIEADPKALFTPPSVPPAPGTP